MNGKRAVPQLRGLVAFAALAVAACGGSDRPTPLSQIETIPAADTETRTNLNISNPTLVLADNNAVAPGETLTLVWSDEFNGSKLDPAVWFFETGDGSQYGADLKGWGNNELQWYLPDNAELDDGKLKITARRERANGYNFTSARINTRDRFAFRYGRIEASIKLPAGQGVWPAFWLLPQDSPYGRWAASGEIDIVEAVNLDGTGGNRIYGTIHYGGEFPNNLSTGARYTPSTDVTEEFNTYAVEWDEAEIRWYVNDTLYAVQNSWSSTAAPFPAPFDQNFYIIFNVAVGGNFPGPPSGATQLPVTMEVDWVRVYSGEPDDGGGGGGSAAIGPVNFEPGGLGQAFTWNVFENVDNPPVAFIANPDASGANGSATVARFTARQAGQPFAGTITNDLPTFTLNATNSCVKIKVWKSVISDVGIKFETGTQASTGEIKVANTVTNQWEELTFDFSGKIGEPSSTDITGFVLFPDFAVRTQENVVYFDDIVFLDGGQCP
jgi:beta-glucanase (GH16 family)